MVDTAPQQKVRRSAIAGTWYPGNAVQLTRTIDEFLGNVPDAKVPGQLIGLVAPHAGYVYSGQTAAYAYKQVQGVQFDVVAVVSPVHRPSYAAPVTVNDSGWYETPLGRVEVDQGLIDALGARITVSRVTQDDEHSLEIQLPFLQRVLGDFKLLPVMQREQSLSTCEVLSDVLVSLLQGRRALLVASTDLSHFHDYDTAVELDMLAGQAIEEYDPPGLARALGQGKTEACGGGPVVTVMLAARRLGANRAQILHYENSGDVTGDWSRVVGYLSAALYEAGGAPPQRQGD